MTTCAWAGECAVCRGTGGGGFHGYCGIPAWLSCRCDGGGVIPRPRCLRYLTKRKTMTKRRRTRRRFSSADHCPGAPCRIHLPGDPVRLLEEFSAVHLHTGAPLQCSVGGSGWDLHGPLVLSKECCCVEEVMKKHRYGPQGGDLHSSALNILNRDQIRMQRNTNLTKFIRNRLQIMIRW